MDSKQLTERYALKRLICIAMNGRHVVDEFGHVRSWYRNISIQHK